ncbi:MAG: hypothetical protein JSV80_12110, partial [Acidobacteriota bacterium]
YPGETISVSIGQGPLMVTPIQMATLAAAIANGGELVTPHLDAGTVVSSEPIGLSPTTLARITQAMVDVVNSDRGTARRARVAGHMLAGKTGTAQVVALDAETDPGDHSWFVGFGPVPRPQLAWAVIVEHGGHGGEAAAPLVGEVMERYLKRRGVEPREPLRVEAARTALTRRHDAPR